MTTIERLSYLEPTLESHPNDLSTLINPCKNLTDAFNSAFEEVEEENLKVFLRIRPLLSEENITSQDGNIDVVNQKAVLLTAPTCSHSFKNKPKGITKLTHKFTFTHVYGQDTSQKVLFEETTQDLVKDLVNGQNCLLFTYGATNSGKTYTIQGTSYHPGLLPRTLDVLFKSVGSQQYKGEDLKPHHFCGVIRMSEKECQKEEEIREQVLNLGASSLSKSYSSIESRIFKDEDIGSIASSFNSTQESTDQTVHSDIFPASVVDSENAYYAIFVSFAEIYNEYIYDLLERSTLIKAKKSPLVLGEDRNGAIYIKGLREIRVTSVEEAMQVLEVGKMNLHFASTRLNQNSSRSHCIFTIKLIRLADPTHPHVARVSMLSLCDLAGAERSGKTQNSMDRLKEANNINTSLLVLGRCMAALRHNQVISKQLCGPRKTVPIPYRDSKVTRLFQSFFMGKGKVAMIVNISMSSVLFDETLKVLKFSALASKVCITQEKPQLADLSVQEHKRSSQFSHFMRHSLNVSNASSARLSVPWNSKNYAGFAFGGGEDKENSKMNDVPEENEENDDPENDEKYEALLQFIEKLKEKLLKECKEKNELEAKLRREICDAFSKRIVEIEDSWRTRLEDQRTRAEEFMDWRMNHLKESVKEKETTRKRFRLDCDDDEEMVPALLLVREEVKVRDLQEAKTQLEEEVDALKASLRASCQSHQNSQEEKSKILFTLADSNQLIDKLQQQKDELESRLQKVSSPVKNKETTENMILEELQLRLQSLEKNVEEKERELKDVKGMLVEAADEFLDKEQTINSLRSALESANETNTRQSVMMSDLESKLSETKSLLDNQRLYLEEREQQIHALNAQLRGDSSVSDETESSKMADFRRLTSGFDSEEESPRTSKLILNLNDEDESPDANGESGLDLSSNQGTSFDEAEKKDDMEQQLKALKAETENLKAENKKLGQQMKDAKEQLEEFIGSEEKLKQFEDKVNSLTLQNEDLKAENEEVLTQQEEHSKKVSDLNDEITRLNDRLDSLSLERDSLAEEKQCLQQKQEETQINACCLEQTLKIYSGNLDTLTSEKICLEEANKDLMKKVRMMEEELRKEMEMKEKSSEVTTLLAERIEALEKEKLELENANKFVNQCLQSKESEYETVLTDMDDKTEHIIMLEHIQESFEDLNHDLENKLSTAEHKLKESEKECEKFKKFMVECDELKTKLSATEESRENLLEMNSSYSAKIESLTKLLNEKSEEKNLDLLTTKNELNELKMKLLQSEEKRSEILSVNSKFVTQIQSLNNLLTEKEELFKKMTEKIDSLERKASSAEEEVEPLKAKCKILEKEVAALREARAEEVSHLKSDLEASQSALAQKDLEISTLQQEVKRSLQASITSESSEMAKQEAIKKEKQDKEIQSLQELLRILEEEKSAYSEELSSLRQEMSQIHESSRTRAETEGNSRSESQLESNSSSRPRRTRKIVSYPSPTIDSVNANVTPAQHPTSPVLHLESSEVESEVNGSTRKLRPMSRRTTKKESSSSKKTMTSQRRTKKLSFDKENQSFEVFTDDDKDDGDFYKPKGILKSSRKSNRKKSTRQTQIQNPHLENDEIKENLLNSSNKDAKESEETNSSRSRRRRRRPLYNLEIDAPFECSPDIVQLPQEDSPHSVVRRKLRSKAK